MDSFATGQTAGQGVPPRLTPEDNPTDRPELAALGRVATEVAHELNNLLGAVRGFAATLEPHLPEGGHAQRAYEELVRTCERGTDLTRRVLDLAHAPTSDITDIDVAVLVQGMQPLLRQLLPGDIRLVAFIGEAIPPVMARERDLELVLLNLVVNARDAIDGQGSIVISVSRGASNLRPEDASVNISVSDSGHGMSPEVRDRAFEPFFTTKETGSGTGLGLSLAREALEACGGGIRIDASSGAGTTVTVTLRARTTSTREQTGQSAASEHVASVAALVWMEAGPQRDLVVTLLLRRGIEVVEVGTFEAAQASLARPDRSSTFGVVGGALAAVARARLGDLDIERIISADGGPTELLDEIARLLGDAPAQRMLRIH